MEIDKLDSVRAPRQRVKLQPMQLEETTQETTGQMPCLGGRLLVGLEQISQQLITQIVSQLLAMLGNEPADAGEQGSGSSPPGSPMNDVLCQQHDARLRRAEGLRT